VVIVERVPWWGVISSAASPVLLVTGSTVAAGLQPRSYNPVADTLSVLAAVGAVDRWVMTSALVGVGVGYFATGLALRPAARAGRLILMAVGVATVLVALNPEHAGHGGTLPHTLWAATGFIVMTAWPVAGRVRGPRVPYGLRPAVAISATVVMLGLLAWFGGELIWAGHQVGLAERALAGIQALWPLAVVLTCTGRGRFRAWPGGGLPSRAVEPHSVQPTLAMLLDRYRPEDGTEIADVRRLRALTQATGDPWRRELPLHVTASVLIAHPPTARVLLRWHQRQQAWLQVGGHGDPGESDPLAIATREAQEETGLADLEPWPDAQIRHVVIVGVPAGKGEPAHEHADVRFFMATQTPAAARPENAQAALRWLSLAAAREATSEPNLIQTLARMERLLTR
jgi:8-oxo-dGTP pyrophosphatase MutT (NUDIX family)/hypothetical membrane protein